MTQQKQLRSSKDSEHELEDVSFTSGVRSAIETQPASPRTLKRIRIVCQGRHGRFWFPRPEVDANQSKQTAMDRVHDIWDSRSAKMPVAFWYYLHGFLWEPVIETGAVSRTRLDDVESGQLTPEVILSQADREASPELTSLFNHHPVLGSADTFGTQHPGVVTGSPGSRVIVVSFRLKKDTVLQVVVFGLLVSIIVGVVLGIVTASVEAGFSAFGGITLVMTVPLGVVFWMTK